MNIEAELLKIIEDQLLLLKQQQQEQKTALQALSQYQNLSELLEQQILLSEQRNSKLRQSLEEYQRMYSRLKNQTFSENILQDLQTELSLFLQQHLKALVTSLQLKEQVNSEIQNQISGTVQNEIALQLQPLTAQIIQKMNSVEHYQEKLQQLIQQLSSKL